MPLKRQITVPIIIFCLLVLVGTGLLFLASYLLPGILESKIISILKNDAGITDVALDFQELDLKGASLGAMRIGTAQDPALIVRSIQINYSPGEIYQKKIKKIVASGVELYCEYKNGRLGLRGFDLQKLFARLDSAGTKKKTSDDRSTPSFPQRIEINNGTLIFIFAQNTYRLPFEIVIVAEENSAHILRAIAHIYPRGQTAKISARLDFEQNRVASQIAAEDLDLLRFADMFKPADRLRIAGFASLDVNADFQLAPFKVSAITGRLKGDPLHVRYKNFEIQGLSDNPADAKALTIDIQGPQQHQWKINLSDFAAVAPVAARFSGLAVTLQAAEDDYKIAGNFKLSFGTSTASNSDIVPLTFKKHFDLPLNFAGRYAKSGDWHLNLNNGYKDRPGFTGAAFEYGQIQLRTKFPELNLTADGSGDQISFGYKLQVPNIHAAAGNVNIFSQQFVLAGKTNMMQNQGSTSTIDIDLSGSTMIANTTTIKMNNLKAKGTLMRGSEGTQDIAGIIRFSNTHMEDTPRSIRLRGARGYIPFKFPSENSVKSGSISIDDVGYQNLNIGLIKADVQQTAAGISFKGNLKSPLIPALSAKFWGESNFGGVKDYEARARFELTYPETGPEINLGAFLPAAEGFTFKGKLREEGNLVIRKNGLTAAVQSSLSNGKLQHRKNNLTIEGIQMALLIPDLLKMHSAPGQKLQFSRASLGDMNIENGEIDFQIESARSLLIEKSHFIWCDGKVDAPAIRFQSGIEDYNLILYCDRLNLAKVLEQFGAASVEAEGELNGRIPIRYKNGQLSFQDGFLFTTPGQRGKIRMTDAEILTAGIPQDTPQYVQMELARKALEDYDYTWAKLNLTSEGEDLLLKMQLDGKPAKSLPFVYRKDMGGFAKVEAGIEGSTFQGIRLDINFRLPLNKILQYKELIQMIQQSRE